MLKKDFHKLSVSSVKTNRGSVSCQLGIQAELFACIVVYRLTCLVLAYIPINKTCKVKRLDLKERFPQTICFISKTSVSSKFSFQMNEKIFQFLLSRILFTLFCSF